MKLQIITLILLSFFYTEAKSEIQWVVGHVNFLDGTKTFTEVEKNKIWRKKIQGWNCGLVPEKTLKSGYIMRSLICSKGDASMALKVNCSALKRTEAFKAFLLGGPKNENISSIILSCGYLNSAK